MLNNKRENIISLDPILLDFAKNSKRILAHVISGGGFEYERINYKLLSFEKEEALLTWIKEFCEEEKESDNNEEPWTLSDEIDDGEIYKITSSTNCRPWESGWHHQSQIVIYYPGNSLIPVDQREPKRTINIIKSLHI